jgi:HNH endonuclease
METRLRGLVRDRAHRRCEYCGLAEEQAYIPHHVDHIRPKQHGGDDSLMNLALACQGCNLKKGPNLAGIDPDSGTMVALFNPREQVWTEHFTFEGAVIVGLSAVGRATVSVLDLNTKERVKIREDA